MKSIKFQKIFEFSEGEVARSKSNHLRTTSDTVPSFCGIHSYYSKPIGILGGNNSLNNIKDVNNKTVAFFN